MIKRIESTDNYFSGKQVRTIILQEEGSKDGIPAEAIYSELEKMTDREREQTTVSALSYVKFSGDPGIKRIKFITVTLRNGQ